MVLYSIDPTLLHGTLRGGPGQWILEGSFRGVRDHLLARSGSPHPALLLEIERNVETIKDIE